MRQPIQHVQPLHIVLTIDGVEIDVSPVTVGQYPALFAHLRPLLEQLPLAPDAIFDRLQQRQASLADAAWLTELLMESGAHVIAALALATGRPREWVAGLLPDRALELLLVAVEVNADFFSRARVPMEAMLAAARAGLPPAAPASTGPTPSAP